MRRSGRTSRSRYDGLLLGRAEERVYSEGPALLLHHGDIRRVLVLHADHVVARVDMQDLAGDAAAEVGEEIERAGADILDGDGPAERRIVLVPFQDIAEVGDAARRPAS